ncbi:hypothetical protein [Allochromatium vinosum]|uniref:ABC transporter permease n=1 Tax=Allochromatium vinosum (strain ATCC 17899 / DSM 180 / NBRC 103801 / NCIMB 10441 / D) TaxID=572477 RepID=D3RUC6_ALLVD|nr:hypothetical protein [Allochromatium vinosum]ADC62785.1 conserved hypothetical protein [Allochromatium vinosum DSM 180]
MGARHRGDLTRLAVVVLIAVLVLALLVVFLLPAATPIVGTLNEGLGIRESVPWGFGLTVALIAFFALVAGDGLLGELQFMLGAFFAFFLILTLLIAWVF